MQQRQQQQNFVKNIIPKKDIHAKYLDVFIIKAMPITHHAPLLS